MYDTEGNKHRTCIPENLFNCRKPHQQIHMKEKKKVLITVY